MTDAERLNSLWPDEQPSPAELARAAHRAGLDYEAAKIAHDHAALDMERKRQVWLEAEQRAQQSTEVKP